MLSQHEPFCPARSIDREIETKIKDCSTRHVFDQRHSAPQLDKSLDSKIQLPWIAVDENWW